MNTPQEYINFAREVQDLKDNRALQEIIQQVKDDLSLRELACDVNDPQKAVNLIIMRQAVGLFERIIKRCIDNGILAQEAIEQERNNENVRRIY